MYPSNPGFGRGLSFWDMKTDHAADAMQASAADWD